MSAAADGTGSDRLPLMSVPDLVGRERELAALAEALSRAPAVVLVEGEAGIGKTRLVQEFLRAPATRTARPMVAVCPPFREPYTLGPLVDAVRAATASVAGLGLSALAGALRPVFPEWAGDLPAAPEPLDDASASRHRLYGALDELLDALGVTLLVVEDVHWADEATLEFLLLLTSRLAHRAHPTALVLTWRPEDTPTESLLRRLLARPPAGVTWLRLPVDALDTSQTARMVSSMLGGDPVSAGFAGFLHARTSGIPLVVEESVRLMHDRADLVRRGGEWVRRPLGRIDVPPTVRDAVLERLVRLRPDARALVQAAAILAEPTSRGVLAAVAALDEDRADVAVTEAVTSRLLRAGDGATVSLGHALAGAAVYEALPGPQRRALHRRAGHALEALRSTPAARLAHHFRHAGETAAWRRHAERAADLALAASDETTAATLLYDLVTTAELPPEAVVRLVAKLPLASFTGPDRFVELAGALRAVLRRSPLTRRQEAQTRFVLGRVLLMMEDDDGARAELELAVRALPPGSRESVAAMTYLGAPRGAAPAAVHRRWLRRAARALPDPVPAGSELSLLVERTSALLQLGEAEGWSEAARIPDTPATPSDAWRIAHAHLNIGDSAVTWGRYAEATRRLDHARRLAERHGYDRLRDLTLVTQAHLSWHTGSWDGLAGRAGELATSDGMQPVSRTEAVLVTGLLHAAAGRPDRAGVCLRQVLDGVRRHGASDYLAEPAAALARLRLAEGNPEEALRASDEAFDVVAGKGIWLWATDLAPARTDALARLGRREEASDLVDAFARGLHGRKAPAPRAGLLLCRAILAEADGDHVWAAAGFARTAAAWDALPRPYEALLARERQARCLLAAGEVHIALSALSDVHAGLSDLGADGDTLRVAETLRGLGAPVGPQPRRGRRGYGDRISPRELDVIRLLAGGRTNRQIAEALVLSRRTVDTHLQSAMRKLQVPTRTAVVMRAVELGLIDGNPHGSAERTADSAAH